MFKRERSQDRFTAGQAKKGAGLRALFSAAGCLAVSAGLVGCGLQQVVTDAAGHAIGVYTAPINAKVSDTNDKVAKQVRGVFPTDAAGNTPALVPQIPSVPQLDVAPPADAFQAPASALSPASHGSLVGLKWPVDTAVIPPPTVFVATGENALASADLPKATAQNVIPVAGSENKFTVEVSQIDQVKTKQEGPTLCWAACTQMLLKQQDILADQTKLAQQFVPDDGSANEDQSAGLGVVIRALSPDLDPKLEARGSIPIDLVSITSDQLLTQLMAGKLCMVGLVQKDDDSGHACVVSGATFAALKPTALSLVGTLAVNPKVPTSHDQALQSALSPAYGLYDVDLLDPWIGEHRTLSAQEFCDQTVFITSYQLAHETLNAALQTATSGSAAAGSKSSKHMIIKSKTRSDHDRATAIAAVKTGSVKPATPARTASSSSDPANKKPIKDKTKNKAKDKSN